jgi:hypothetical protein
MQKAYRSFPEVTTYGDLFMELAPINCRYSRFGENRNFMFGGACVDVGVGVLKKIEELNIRICAGIKHYMAVYIVAYLLKAKTVRPEKQPTAITVDLQT